MDRDSRKTRAEELPHQVRTDTLGKQESWWGGVVRGAQGNFDHLMGVIRDLVSKHNSLVDDFDKLKEFAEDGLADTPTAEHVHDGTDPDGGGGSVSHASLTNVTAAQHHAEVTVGTGLDVTGQLVELDLSEVAAGGELGGFMDAPTVDVTHSGSAHHATPDAEPVADAHIADTADAHDASAVSADSTTLVGVGTDVQAVLEELDNSIVAATHDPVTVGTGLDVTGQLVELDLSEVAAGGELGGFMDAPTVDATHAGSAHHATPDAEPTADAHIADGTDAHDASAISILDTAADFDATDVEGALAELQSDAEGHVAAADPNTGYLKESVLSEANVTDLTDGGATTLHTHAGGSGHVIEEEGTPLAARTGLNFIGAGVAATDDAGGDETDITITEPVADAHVADGTDAHDASAISILDAAGDFTATDVEGALAELQADAEAHAAAGSGESVLCWSSRVNLVTNQTSRRIYVPYACTVQRIYFSLPAANTGTTIIDVHKNGTTLYTTQANRPTLTVGFRAAATVPDVTSIAQYDYLECAIDQVGGASGRLIVYIVVI